MQNISQVYIDMESLSFSASSSFFFVFILYIPFYILIFPSHPTATGEDGKKWNLVREKYTNNAFSKKEKKAIWCFSFNIGKRDAAEKKFTFASTYKWKHNFFPFSFLFFHFLRFDLGRMKIERHGVWDEGKQRECRPKRKKKIRKLKLFFPVLIHTHTLN